MKTQLLWGIHSFVRSFVRSEHLRCVGLCRETALDQTARPPGFGFSVGPGPDSQVEMWPSTHQLLAPQGAWEVAPRRGLRPERLRPRNEEIRRHSERLRDPEVLRYPGTERCPETQSDQEIQRLRELQRSRETQPERAKKTKSTKETHRDPET